MEWPTRLTTLSWTTTRLPRSSQGAIIRSLDPFDLPEWLGTDSVCWRAEARLGDGPHVEGAFTSSAGDRLRFALLAVDAAYPVVVCPEPQRREAHQAWGFGSVLLLEVDGAPAAAAPARRFDADLVCETVRRVAAAVGARAGEVTVSIQV